MNGEDPALWRLDSKFLEGHTPVAELSVPGMIMLHCIPCVPECDNNNKRRFCAGLAQDMRSIAVDQDNGKQLQPKGSLTGLFKGFSALSSNVKSTKGQLQRIMTVQLAALPLNSDVSSVGCAVAAHSDINVWACLCCARHSERMRLGDKQPQFSSCSAST